MANKPGAGRPRKAAVSKVTRYSVSCKFPGSAKKVLLGPLFADKNDLDAILARCVNAFDSFLDPTFDARCKSCAPLFSVETISIDETDSEKIKTLTNQVTSLNKALAQRTALDYSSTNWTTVNGERHGGSLISEFGHIPVSDTIDLDAVAAAAAAGEAAASAAAENRRAAIKKWFDETSNIPVSGTIDLDALEPDREAKRPLDRPSTINEIANRQKNNPVAVDRSRFDGIKTKQQIVAQARESERFWREFLGDKGLETAETFENPEFAERAALKAQQEENQKYEEAEKNLIKHLVDLFGGPDALANIAKQKLPAQDEPVGNPNKTHGSEKTIGQTIQEIKAQREAIVQGKAPFTNEFGSIFAPETPADPQ